MIFRKFIPAVFSLALGLMVCACSGSGISVGNTSLEREVAMLRQEVADLKDQGRGGAGAGGGTLQMRQEIDSMRTSIQRLNESVETASLGGLTIRQQLEFLSARLDRLEKRANLPPLSPDIVAPTALSPEVPVLATPPVAPGAQGPPLAPQAQDGPIQTGPPVVAGPSGEVPQVPPPVAPPSAYDQGKALFDQKNYAAALGLFREYLAAEPSGSQAAAAQFYIGECLYFQNQFEDAILEYQVVVSGYPKNSLVSNALLKQGLSFQAVGDNSSAKILYQKVVRDYPNSYSAGVARERLKTM